MNKRQTKKRRSKALNKPVLARRESGMLGGYTCPTCGNRHVKEPYCKRCNQMLIYDEEQRESAPLWKSNKEWERASMALRISSVNRRKEDKL